MTKPICILLLIAASISSIAQTDTIDRVLTPLELQEDIDFLYSKLLSIHPNPYYKLTPEQLQEKIQFLKQSCNIPLTSKDFWIKLVSLKPYFDTHTTFVYGDEFWNNLANQKFIVPPFSFTCKEGQLFFSQWLPFWNDSLKGKKIKTLNHISADTICTQIQSWLSYESSLEKNGWEMIRFFDIFVFLSGATDTLTIEYLEDKQQLNTITLIADSIEGKKWTTYFMNNGKVNEKYSFRSFPQESIAILELNSFAIYSPDEYKAYKKYIRNSMNTVVKQKIRHLFIDISINNGGSSGISYEILKFIKTRKKSVYMGDYKQKISAEIKQLYHSPKHQWLLLFNKQYRNIMRTPEGSFYNISENLRKKRNSKQFTQNVYLIQSRHTYSAAVNLVTAFREFKAGITIGEETGGLTSGYIGAVSLSLPHSKIEYICATQEFVQAGSKKDGRGFFPDIEYPITNFFQSFTIEQLKEMLQLIEERNK